MISKITIVLFAALFLVAATGCKHNMGSREFIPGKGWTPTR